MGIAQVVAVVNFHLHPSHQVHASGEPWVRSGDASHRRCNGESLIDSQTCDRLTPGTLTVTISGSKDPAMFNFVDAIEKVYNDCQQGQPPGLMA